MAAHKATPLIALDALVIDTETTGLDAGKARVVEIGCVPVVSGKIVEPQGFRIRINPGVPIPAEAARIHGIDDGAVASSPSFAEAWPDLAEKLAAEADKLLAAVPADQAGVGAAMNALGGTCSDCHQTYRVKK